MGLRDSFDDYFYDDYDGDDRRTRAKRALSVVVMLLSVAIGILVWSPWNDSPTASDRFQANAGAVDSALTVTTLGPFGVPTIDDPFDPFGEPTTADPPDTSTELGDTQTSSVGSGGSTVDSADAPTGAGEPGTVRTLPDGEPVPVSAIVDSDSITLAGEVPSQAAIDQLSVLWAEHSQLAATVTNKLVLNPAVPINVGVRLIELNSEPFSSGSAEVGQELASELDRVVLIMAKFPHVSVVVVGHSDQREAGVLDFALSDARARAVVSYLVAAGVAAERVSSRAVGADDPLIADDDEASLALNRRTEFVFYGLLLHDS